MVALVSRALICHSDRWFINESRSLWCGRVKSEIPYREFKTYYVIVQHIESISFVRSIFKTIKIHQFPAVIPKESLLSSLARACGSRPIFWFWISNLLFFYSYSYFKWPLSRPPAVRSRIAFQAALFFTFAYVCFSRLACFLCLILY